MSLRLVAMLSFIALCALSCPAQSSVDQLFNASDAGQRQFEQSQRAGGPGSSATVHDVSTVDTIPTYPGGDTALFKRLLNNATCPQPTALDSCIGHSKVVVSFIVEKDGTVTSPQFLQEACAPLRAAALCAIMNTGTWTPGRSHGEPARVRMSLPIIYDLR